MNTREQRAEAFIQEYYSCPDSDDAQYAKSAYLAGDADRERIIQDQHEEQIQSLVDACLKELLAKDARIEKLREALESYDFGPGTIGHDTLKNDDQLSAQDAR